MKAPLIPSRIISALSARSFAAVTRPFMTTKDLSGFDPTAPKLAIIGAGVVGSHVLPEIIRTFNPTPLNIVFYNRTEARAQGEAMNAAGVGDDGRSNNGFRVLVTSDPDHLTGSDVVIYTSGVSAAALGSSVREEALPFVSKDVKKYGELIGGLAPRSRILMVTNPVETATELMQSATGFPAGRVIGTGTEIDARRFRRAFLQELKSVGMDVETVNAEVIGAHTDEGMIVARNSIRVNGMPISSDLERHEEIERAIKNATDKMKGEGFDIVRLKGSGASFEPAEIMVMMAKAMLQGVEGGLKVNASYVLRGEEKYGGVGDVCISLPVTISKDSVKIDHERVGLTDEELNRLDKIAESNRKLFTDTSMSPEMLARINKTLERLDKKAESYQNRTKWIEEGFDGAVSDAVHKPMMMIASTNPGLFFEIAEESSRFLRVRLKDEFDTLPNQLKLSLLEMLNKKCRDANLDDCNINTEKKVLSIPSNTEGKRFAESLGISAKKTSEHLGIGR